MINIIKLFVRYSIKIAIKIIIFPIGLLVWPLAMFMYASMYVVDWAFDDEFGMKIDAGAMRTGTKGLKDYFTKL